MDQILVFLRFHKEFSFHGIEWSLFERVEKYLNHVPTVRSKPFRLWLMLIFFRILPYPETICQAPKELYTVIQSNEFLAGEKELVISQPLLSNRVLQNVPRITKRNRISYTAKKLVFGLILLGAPSKLGKYLLVFFHIQLQICRSTSSESRSTLW